MIKTSLLNEPVMNHPISCQAEMADIARAFSLSLADSLNEIESVLEPMSEEKRVECLANAIRIAHKIRGCAGTLSFDTIGSAFAAMEDQLRMIEINHLQQRPEALTAIASSIELCKSLIKIQKNESLITGETPVFHIAPMLTAGARAEDLERLIDESAQLIMLIEDDSFYISIVQAVLSSDASFNNGVLSARTLAEASQLLADCEPDIILLDLSLPDGDGVESFNRIQKLAPDVPILILTAKENSPLADELVACGAQDYLVKSRISPDALNRCIRYSITRFKAEKSMMRLRTLEDFNASLAHDLRVPVQGADRILEHILNGQIGSLSPELKHTLQVLNDSNKGLLDRLNKLLNLYRIEFGSVEVSWEQVAILPNLTETLLLLKPDIDAKQLTVHIDEDSDRLFALTDPSLLQEVFQELLTNAIKFATIRDTIEIRLERLPTKVVIRVSNHGTYIKPEDKRELFKKFWRGTPGETYVATSGLGLYYCQKVLNLLEGTIGCRSNPNLTTFTVRLPASQADIP